MTDNLILLDRQESDTGTLEAEILFGKMCIRDSSNTWTLLLYRKDALYPIEVKSKYYCAWNKDAAERLSLIHILQIAFLHPKSSGGVLTELCES